MQAEAKTASPANIVLTILAKIIACSFSPVSQQ